MTTHASRLYQVHPWGTAEQERPRRRVARSMPVLPDRVIRDVAGGLVVLGSCVALWAWFLAATW